MAFFRKKPVVVEAFTFDEVVAEGRAHCAANGIDLNDGMPWSFPFRGHPITHENDCCYLIPTREGIMQLTANDMLIVGVEGEIYPIKTDIFHKTYEDV